MEKVIYKMLIAFVSLTFLTVGCLGNKKTSNKGLQGASRTEAISEISKIKWHPGHYLEAYHPDRPAEYAAALNSPYMKGIQMRYKWRDLEIDKGKYDFTDIDRNLAEVKAKGKTLFVYLLDQDYWGNGCVPDYMTVDPLYRGGQVFKGKRSNPRLWESQVMDRYIALYEAIGKRYDSDPNFEGISSNEREIAARDSTYSDRKYADQIIRLQVALAKAFPTSMVFESLGWTPHIDEIVQNVYKLGLGITCSDLILPGNFSYKGRTYSHSWIYPYYNSMRGKIPMANSGQVGMQASFGSGHSMEQIFNYAVGDESSGLQLTHMMWVVPWDPPGFTFEGTILPVIEAKNGFVANIKCPENLLKFKKESPD